MWEEGRGVELLTNYYLPYVAFRGSRGEVYVCMYVCTPWGALKATGTDYF